MKATNNIPGEQAIRAAAAAIYGDGFTRDCEGRGDEDGVEDLAKTIEEETRLPELLQIVQELDSRFKGKGTMTDSELRALTEKALRLGEGNSARNEDGKSV